MELAFLGEGLELEFFDDDAANAFLNPLVLQNTPESTSPVLDAWQHLDIVAFVLCYFVYVILILIVMLNLLIAMMSATYEDTAQTARLAYRVDYARLVLRLELEVPSWTRAVLHAGKVDAATGSHYYEFRSVDLNSEGRALGA